MAMKTILGIAAWCLLALMAIGNAGNPDLAVSVWLFWAGSGVLVIMGLKRASRGAQKEKAQDGSVVSVCLGIPIDPGVGAAFEAIPPAFQQLIRIGMSQIR